MANFSFDSFHVQESDRLLSLLHNLQSVSHFPIHIYNTDTDLMFYPTSKSILEDPFEKSDRLYPWLKQQNGLIEDSDNAKILYLVQILPASHLCILGPICRERMHGDELYHYAKKHSLKHCFDYRMVQGTPEQLTNAFALIYQIYTGEDFVSPSASTTNKQSDNTDPIKENLFYDIQQYQLELSEREFPHFPYEVEVRALEALKNGNESAFYEAVKEIPLFSTGEYAKTSLKQSEYNAVIMIALMTRSLISGGASSQDAYAISDQMLLKASACQSEKQFNQLLSEAISLFFDLAHKKEASSEASIHISECKNYIIHNLNKELSIDKIANEIHISRSYLLSLFPKYEHLTIMSYIYQGRIHAAANKLKYSDFSIIRIAEYFQFQTQSHFGVVFKKYMGISPAAYRKKYKPIQF